MSLYILVQLTLFKIAVSHLLLYIICCIVSFSFLLSVSFIGNVDRLLVRYLIAASLCLGGWQESLGIIMSVPAVRVECMFLSNTTYFI